jgi:DNA-binding CsgD family transcriptional regulator
VRVGCPSAYTLYVWTRDASVQAAQTRAVSKNRAEGAHSAAQDHEAADRATDRIVAGLYRAAAGELAWEEPLAAMQRLFDAWGVHLHGVNLPVGEVAFSFEVGGFPPEAALAYIRHYHRIDPRAALVARLDTGHWISCHHEFDDAFVARDPFYQEFLIPFGGRYVSGSKVYQDDELIAFLGIHRGRTMQPLDDSALELGARLGAHVGTALGLWRRQRRQQLPAPVGDALLRQLPHPVLLVDAQLHVHQASDAARRWLAGDARIALREGQLEFARRAEHEAALRALRTLSLAAQHPGSRGDAGPAPERSLLRLGPGPGAAVPALLIVTALWPERTMGAFGPQQLAMVVVHDPAHPRQVDPFLAAALFDLTPAEAAVAVRVAAGMTPARIAAEHGVALATVRSQLGAVFAKMGVRRQAEVAGALAALPLLG